jgi:glycosyltransferase involved in cell wall biosynthesis
MMSEWAWKHHGTRKKIARYVIHPGALEAVAGWHATSQEEAAEIRALGFQQPICVAPNGVTAPKPEEISAATTHWQEACPPTAERPVALFYSRFHQKKRVIELIDVWLEHAPRDWLLLLVGLPQDYTPEMLERYVLRASGAGRVRAFNGAGQPPPYAVASLFLLPSHSENFGLVIADAMAHGVPALVTNTTPWSAINAHGAGWCVPWDDFGAALRTATAESPEALRARGEIARAWVLRECSWGNSARTLLEFYRELQSPPA